MPSRPRLESARPQRDEDDLADFCEYLLDALEIPEIRSALAAAIETHRHADRVALPAKPTRSARGQHRTGRR